MPPTFVFFAKKCMRCFSFRTKRRNEQIKVSLGAMLIITRFYSECKDKFFFHSLQIIEPELWTNAIFFYHLSLFFNLSNSQKHQNINKLSELTELIRERGLLNPFNSLNLLINSLNFTKSELSPKFSLSHMLHMSKKNNNFAMFFQGTQIY